jgi:hypothetical protein
MTLKILDDSMTSDRTPHTARPASGSQHTWEVSWLPGRHLPHGQAVTAMVLADATAYNTRHPSYKIRPHVEGWAAELGLTTSQALHRVASPPRWATQQDKTAELPDAEWPDADPPHPQWPDPDPPDPDWPDLDLPDPDWPDSCWHGPADGGTRPSYSFNLAVSDWYKQRNPDKSANLWDALHVGRDPQPAPEPDRQADWEAGQ